jgi:jasmonate O-methyltransferase
VLEPLVEEAETSGGGGHSRPVPSGRAESRLEVSVYLNDLPDNDFNLVFKAVPAFLEKHMGTTSSPSRRCTWCAPLSASTGSPRFHRNWRTACW